MADYKKAAGFQNTQPKKKNRQSGGGNAGFNAGFKRKPASAKRGTRHESGHDPRSGYEGKRGASGSRGRFGGGFDDQDRLEGRQNNSFGGEHREDFHVDLPGDRDELIVYGKNAVLETLLSGAEVNKLLVIKDSRDHTIQKIIDICKEKKYPIRFADKATIDRAESGLHQGAVLYTSPYRYADMDEILECAAGKGERPFVVILDGITDPHNLGAIIRTAEAAGVHGVIIPKRGSVPVTGSVVKISSGAAEHILIARVSNLVSTMKELKDRGFWIVGTSPDAKDNYTDHDFGGSLAIVIGSEGKGMSRLVAEHCDHVLRIDMYGKTSSLNASVAAGVLMFEALRQRKRDKTRAAEE